MFMQIVVYAILTAGSTITNVIFKQNTNNPVMTVNYLLELRCLLHNGRENY